MGIIVSPLLSPALESLEQRLLLSAQSIAAELLSTSGAAPIENPGQYSNSAAPGDGLANPTPTPAADVLLSAGAHAVAATSPLASQYDPALSPSLAWSSYLGGGDWDNGNAVAIDDDGNAWVTGCGGSGDWVTGGFDTSYNGGSSDVFVAKINADGTLAWSSYLGGSDQEVGLGIAIDGSGNAWVTGYTATSDWVSGGFDTIYNGGNTDAFVAKINADGTLAWSSCLGGSGDDFGFGIAVDDSGNAWVTGRTTSLDLASNGFDMTGNGGADAFVAEINADGTLAWSSYLGGSGDDSGFGIAVDSSGNACVTGQTNSSNLASGGFDTTYNGAIDAFVAKIDADGTLAWSSYLGGTRSDSGHGIVADDSDSVWVTGNTASSNLASGGFDTSANGGDDAFVAKIDADGTLAWSSYLGGTHDDFGNGIAVDGDGNAWVTGQTSSTDLAGGGFDTTANGGDDAFIAQINADGTLAWSSYVGGDGSDYGYGVAIDGNGDAWMTGSTDSSALASDGFDTSYNGNTDGFVAKIGSGPINQDPNHAPTDIALSASSIAEKQPAGTIVGVLSGSDPDAGQSATLSFTLVSGFGDNAQFSIDPATNQLRTAASFDYQAASSYSIEVRATDTGSPALTYDEVFTIDVTPVVAPPTNSPPTADTASFAVSANAATIISLVGQDTETAAADLVFNVPQATVGGGTLLRTAQGQYQYTPPTDFVGQDSFQFSVTDGGSLTSEAATVSIRVGTYKELLPGKKTTWTDANQHLVTFCWTGRVGTGLAYFANDLAGDPIKIILNGTTARDSIAIASKFATTVGQVVIEGDLKSFCAKAVSLSGPMAVTGAIGSILLNDINADGGTLSIGGPNVASRLTTTTLTFDRVAELNLTSAMPIKSLKATEWLDDPANGSEIVSAPYVASLKILGHRADVKGGVAQIMGDFQPNMSLTGIDAKGVSLGTFCAAGAVSGTWTMPGAAKVIAMSSSTTNWQATFGSALAWADVCSITTKAGDLSGAITARSIGSITAKASVTSAAITLKRGPDAKLLALGKLTAGAWIDASSILSAGAIGTVTAGGMRNSAIFAGVANTQDKQGVGGVPDSVLDLPQVADLASPTMNLLASIKSVTIKGMKNVAKQPLNSFINSNIAAGSLGKISLAYAALNNDGNAAAHDVPFGLTGKSLAGLTYADADKTHKYTWKAGSTVPGWFDDLAVRLM